MSNSINGLTAIVTGGSSGIGKAIAISLASCGVNVVISGRNEERLKEVTSIINSKKEGKAEYFIGDLTIEGTSEKLLDFTLSKFKKLDILINNAGVAHHSLFLDVSNEEFDKIINTNVKVPFMLTKACLKNLRETHGTIINICSAVAHKGYPEQSIYSCSKHALLGMSKALANEEYKNDVRVHVICPGAVLTEMSAMTRPDLVGTSVISLEDVTDSIIYLLTHRLSCGVIDEIKIHRSLKEPF